jgi:hypothetical protein
MAVRVRDLEIALVLAREMKAAAERSVDASLRLDQLQEVFGVEELDRAERARIQTALQMAGLEPFPSLLEADPSEPIRFGASKTAVASGATTMPPPAPPSPAEEEELPPVEDGQPAFPTVGQFARSKLRSRRFGVRRGDHGEDDAPPPAAPPDPTAVEPNGYPPHETDVHDQVELHDEPIAGEEAEEELLAGEEHAPEEAHEEHDPELEYEEHEPVVDVQPEDPYEEPEPAPDQREYIPLAQPQPQPQPQPVAYEEPEAEPRRVGAAEVMAILLPAVAIPVIVTSIAGWEFGLPFVALTVVAAGSVMSREKRGFFASIRESGAARTVLTVTVVVSVVSGAAAVVLASLPDKSSTTKKSSTPAKRAQPPVASKPATPAPAPHKKKKPKPAAKHHHHATTSKPPPATASAPPTTAATPPPDPATQGLIRVSPSGGATGTKTTP